MDVGAMCGTDGVVVTTRGAVEVDEECNKELTKGWVFGPSEGVPAIAALPTPSHGSAIAASLNITPTRQVTLNMLHL
jgi:hypothetical protein